MRTLATITDPVFTPTGQYSALDRFFISLLSDERDLPFVYLTLKITFTMVVLGIALYFIEGWLWWVGALVYFVLNNFVYKGPFGLMLHCTSHRRFFKPEYGFLNHYLPWIVSPFFGQTPETYYSHHVHMHHAENNLPDDLSTTMNYQRDSLRDWFRYYLVFISRGLVDLINYFRRRERPKLMRAVIIGESTFIIFCILLSLVDFPTTLIVFIIPFIIYRIVAMLGNFAQHTFVDPEEPGNPYKNSITCINHPYNHKCWNDGYHISHHQRPHMHWTEHPIYFQKTLDQYVTHRALVFEDMDFLRVLIAVMRKDYDKLADHLVNIDGMFASREEAIAVMKERTRRFSDEAMQRKWTNGIVSATAS